MPQLDDLTDVCKDGNLLKVNSCNCAAELDEAKEGVSTASIIVRKKEIIKEQKQIRLQRPAQNKHFILWMRFIWTKVQNGCYGKYVRLVVGCLRMR